MSFGDERRIPARWVRGRGSADNPANRFERSRVESDPDADDPDLALPPGRPATTFLPDRSRTIVATNNSPDLPFDASLNPYRGCEHGCSYCYARPTHEYLGFSAGLDFETRILVKHDAPGLLRKTLMSPAWKPRQIALSGVTDPYQPGERKLRLTRQCLEVLAEFRNPLSIVTKNALVTRDLDVLSELASVGGVVVFLSITTLDAALARTLEPRTSPPERRLWALSRLAEAGIPVGVMVAPVIPGLNDHEIPAILREAATAGARHADWIPLRLPGAVAPLFEAWLDEYQPGRKEKVLSRIRSMRGGKLNDSRFGERMRGEGELNGVIARLFRTSCRREGLNDERLVLRADAFRRPEGHAEGREESTSRQMRLFD
ncbi:MAG: PA0069 family radical SAM protein [Isosphaeraceae bacterium]